MARTSTSSTRAISRERLTAQHLVGDACAPEAVVAHLLAVQAQELPGATWSVALRARCSRADVEQALADGRILRTHVMRPTWHLVAAADARWLLTLTAPRLRRLLEGVNAKHGLTSIPRHLRDIAKRLPLSRAEIAKLTGLSGIPLANLCIYAELEQIMISGAEGYAAFDARVPATRPPADPLAALATRYFASHGPATIHDLAWWSGLTLADCRRGAAHLTAHDGYYGEAAPTKRGSVFLVPTFDELLVGYRAKPKLENTVLRDGEPIGTWRRTPFSVDAPDSPALRGAVRRYQAWAARVTTSA